MLGDAVLNPDNAIPRQLFVCTARAKVQSTDKMIGTYGRQVAWNSGSASPPDGAPEQERPQLSPGLGAVSLDLTIGYAKSVKGQKRRFDNWPGTSGLPPTSDISLQRTK
jgi:hypothetical protein